MGRTVKNKEEESMAEENVGKHSRKDSGEQREN